jgi:hypothetical protein
MPRKNLKIVQAETNDTAEIAVTPQMAIAGARTLAVYSLCEGGSARVIAAEVFKAMMAARS